MPGSPMVATSYMFIPMFVTIFVQKVIYRKPVKEPLGISFKIISYIRLKAKSVMAAPIIHGSLNATIALPLMVIKGGNDLAIRVTGPAGFIALILMNTGTLIYDFYFAREKIMTHNDNISK